jgi:hypothetical protein
MGQLASLGRPNIIPTRSETLNAIDAGTGTEGSSQHTADSYIKHSAISTKPTAVSTQLALEAPRFLLALLCAKPPISWG